MLWIHLIRKPVVPINDMIRCKQSILTHFLSIFDSLFRITLIRSMISDTSRVEGRSCNQLFDIIGFYIASLWKTHFLFVWSNLWVSHWSCKSWYRSGCRYSGFPRLKWIEKVSCIWFCNYLITFLTTYCFYRAQKLTSTPCLPPQICLNIWIPKRKLSFLL